MKVTPKYLLLIQQTKMSTAINYRRRWTPNDLQQLSQMFSESQPIAKIAKQLQRTERATAERMFGIIEKQRRSTALQTILARHEISEVTYKYLQGFVLSREKPQTELISLQHLIKTSSEKQLLLPKEKELFSGITLKNISVFLLQAIGYILLGLVTFSIYIIFTISVLVSLQ